MPPMGAAPVSRPILNTSCELRQVDCQQLRWFARGRTEGALINAHDFNTINSGECLSLRQIPRGRNKFVFYPAGIGVFHNRKRADRGGGRCKFDARPIQIVSGNDLPTMMTGEVGLTP